MVGLLKTELVLGLGLALGSGTEVDLRDSNFRGADIGGEQMSYVRLRSRYSRHDRPTLQLYAQSNCCRNVSSPSTLASISQD